MLCEINAYEDNTEVHCCNNDLSYIQRSVLLFLVYKWIIVN